MLKAIASITIASAAVFGTMPEAKAFQPGGGCYPSLAVSLMKEVLMGGGTAAEAYAAAYDEGYFDRSKVCVYRITGVARERLQRLQR